MKKALLFFLFLPLLTHAQIITTFAGNSTPGFGGDGGPATAANLYDPAGLVIDTHGNMFIADEENYCIRKILPSGIIQTVAGTGGVQGFSGDGGSALLAEMNEVTGVAVDRHDNIFIVDHLNCRIRKVDRSGTISTYAGDGSLAYGGDGGPATAAQLYFPWGIISDSAGNIYFSDQYNNCVRKISTAGIITTIAGTSTAGFSGDGGPATAAMLQRPSGIAMDCLGNFYIADQYNARIRKIDPSGIISTIAGTGTNGFSGDGGPATNAKVNIVWGIAVDNDGNLYLSDANNDRLREITTEGVINTIAGIGAPSYSGDGGPATAAEIKQPMGIIVDSLFNIYFADYDNYRIRKISSTVAPVNPGTITGVDSSVCPGDSISLSVIGGAGSGQWSSNNTNIAFISPSGKVTGNSPGIDTVRYTVPAGLCNFVSSTYRIVVKPVPHPTVTYLPICCSVPNVYTSYQWIYWAGGPNDTLTGDTTSSHTFYSLGDYYLIVDSGGCYGISDTGYVAEEVKSINNANDNIRLYPNPASSSLTLTSVNAINSLIITDLLGQTVYTRQFSSQQVRIDVADLPKGIYFVKVNGSAIRKFVKE